MQAECEGRYNANGGWGGIRTHGRLHVAGFQDRCLKPLGHPSLEGKCLSPGEPSCARHALNDAGGEGASHSSLGCEEERVLSGSGRWILVALVAAWFSPAAAQIPGYAQPTYAQPMSAWDGYKLRLAALARQQGVRESTIQSTVPNLSINQRVINLERTEPVARTSGG